MMKFLDLQKSLNERSEQDLYRHRRILNSAQKAQVLADGEYFLNFASNDYLGLANHQTAIEKLSTSANQYGFGSGASHLICGHKNLQNISNFYRFKIS